jgi:ABC-2 type transport system permease protein
MRQILLLLNVKAATFLKGATDFRLANLVKNFSSAIIFGGVAVGVFLLSRAATGYLLDQQHIGLFLFHRFLSMLLYVFFVTVNLGNMIVCYATLYKSDEVNFLMGLPVRHENIFVVKFIDNFFYSSSTLFLLGIALLLGYGSHFDMPWYFYFFTLFAVLLPFMLVAGIFAVIVLMVLLKIASRVGIRWLLAGIMAVYLSAIYAYFTLTNPVHLVQEVMRHYPDVNAYFGYLDPPFIRFLPNHWVAEFLYWTMVGEDRWATANLGGLFAVLAVLVVIAGIMARVYYYSSWLTVTGARPFRLGRQLTVAPSFLHFGRRRLISWQTDSLLRRDFWSFFREPSQWLHMLLMLLLLVIFLTSMSTLELKLTQPFMQTVSYLVIFLFNGFLIASVTLRFVFPAVSLEGDAFWCVRSAPMSLRKLYWHKFAGAFVPIFLVAEILAAVSTWMLRNGGVLVLMGAVCSGFIALTLTSVNLGAGAYFATYREKNPIRVASSQGASLTFLGSMLYLGAVVLVMMVPVNRYFETLILRGTSAPAWLYVPIAAVGILSLLLFLGSTLVGLATIRRDY